MAAAPDSDDGVAQHWTDCQGDNLQARFLAAINHFRQVWRRLARKLLDLKQSQILSPQMDYVRFSEI